MTYESDQDSFTEYIVDTQEQAGGLRNDGVHTVYTPRLGRKSVDVKPPRNAVVELNHFPAH
jgi:hypothetical protein